MLTCIRVRDLAIIDDVEVELGPGLNVITGETGAGKSILVTALGLVLGARGRTDLVRTGAERAEVEALFDLGDDPNAAERITRAGLDSEDATELLVRRVITSAGRTRAYVNGRLATTQQLTELMSGLVDISSQHEHHTLVDPNTHLTFLDAFGQLHGERDAMVEHFRAVRAAEAALADARKTAATRGEREDLLRFQINEIDELSPVAGEEEELRVERDRLRHAQRLVTAAGGAEAALYADDDALCTQLGRIAQSLNDAADIDPTLRPLAESVESALAQLEEASRELGAYAQDVTMDPARLSEVEERLHRLHRLAQKYGGDVGAILDHRERAAEELSRLDRAEEEIERLSADRDRALFEAARLARALSKERHAAASTLGDKISAELSSLGMGQARVQVRVEKRADAREDALCVDDARLSETGIDRVEFLIAPNPGEDPKPLRRIASGGELSRAMLAIKRVLADVQRPMGSARAVYVFDEVDSGVGGAVAESIGLKLAEVAEHHQVICVTHLAQIAVYGAAHYRVSKSVGEGRTRSEITVLSPKARKEEIARMVGGLEITANTRRAAAELLRSARVRSG